jgi:putative DNA primase/helicase
LTFDLKSPLLAQMVTEGIVDIRPFGKNTETVLCDCRATTAFANGNNIMVVGELVRRTVTSRMDANIEQPELRKFKSDPIEKVLRNRGKYLAAIFTIVRAHMAAKAPPGAAIAVAGFERWSKIVQQPLMWLGQEDPMKSQEEARAQDPERGALKERIEALKNHFGTANFTAAKINELAKMSGSGNPDLFAAYSRGANVMGTKSIGRLLIKDLGRVVNGWKIAVTRDRRLGNVYYLVQEPGAGAGDNGDSVDDADAMAAGRDAGFD